LQPRTRQFTPKEQALYDGCVALAIEAAERGIPINRPNLSAAKKKKPWDIPTWMFGHLERACSQRPDKATIYAMMEQAVDNRASLYNP
jgi:hypothetical protein